MVVEKCIELIHPTVESFRGGKYLQWVSGSLVQKVVAVSATACTDFAFCELPE